MAGAPTVPIRSLAVAQSGPAAPLFVFAGTDSDVLRRDSAWSVLTGLTLTGGAQAILADPFGDVYVGTGGNGIQRSADFGVTWSDFSAGLPAGTSVTALAITGSTLYTGTAAGGTFSAPVSLPVSVPEVHGGLPASFAVGPCFPDPARGSTTLQFALPAASVVTLSIYDVQGHRMAQPLDHILEQPGVYDVPVRSDPWKPGMYFYRLVAGDRSAARKFVVLK
jgi:hypothetical protein